MQAFKKLALPLMVVAALLAGCGENKSGTAEEAKPTQVAAKVNGTDLTVAQVDYALQRIPNLDKEQTKAASLQVIRSLVNQEVLAQKAQEEKLDRDPTVVQALDAAHRQILAEAYMNRTLGTTPAPSDAEVSDYFNQHPELFAKRKIYRLQEISIKAPDDKREEIRKQLAASKNLNDFVTWLNAEKFPVQTAQGIKPAEQLPPELVSKLAEVPDGKVVVVNIPGGVLVIMVAASQVQPVTFEQAKPAIARMLQAEARQKAAKAELDKLKAAAKIEYLGEFAAADKANEAPSSKGEPAAPAASAAPAADAGANSKSSPGPK